MRVVVAGAQALQVAEEPVADVVDDLAAVTEDRQPGQRSHDRLRQRHAGDAEREPRNDAERGALLHRVDRVPQQPRDPQAEPVREDEHQQTQAVGGRVGTGELPETSQHGGDRREASRDAGRS